MSRDSGTSEMIDLSSYTYDKLEYLVSGFDKARKAGCFLAQHKLLSIHVRTHRSLSILDKEGSINGRRLEVTSIVQNS
jgi:hypothetical protein